MPLNGPLWMALFFMILLSVDERMAIPSPYRVSSSPKVDRPMLSRAVMSLTMLCEPPSMTIPPSKSLTVPSVIWTFLLWLTRMPAPSPGSGVPNTRKPFRSSLTLSEPTTIPSPLQGPTSPASRVFSVMTSPHSTCLDCCAPATPGMSRKAAASAVADMHPFINPPLGRDHGSLRPPALPKTASRGDRKAGIGLRRGPSPPTLTGRGRAH